MENVSTTLSPDNRFHPFTFAEFIEVKDTLRLINTHIPNNLMGWVWNTYKIISKSNEPQPCSCGSASGHWVRAVNTIRTFVDEKSTLL